MSRRDDAVRRRSVPVFAALGDETRLLLIGRLQRGEKMSLTRLTEGIDLTRQAVAKHVRVLEKARLVRCSRIGRETLVELTPERMEEAAAYLRSVSEQWDDALGRLKAFVES
ncbi:MAG: winged helix-turn-helix transcriptional regulator [Acidobacteria bacterium]|nr:winged helix-turn-helix transcriptional regulator [Acidobacteriota bacterium]